jgi:putative ABC transport system permease protein
MVTYYPLAGFCLYEMWRDMTDTVVTATAETVETAAFALIARDGVARLTLPAIAAEAGVPLAAVQAVYGSHAAVVRALLRRASESDLTATAGETPGGWDGLTLQAIARAVIATRTATPVNEPAPSSPEPPRTDSVPPTIAIPRDAAPVTISPEMALLSTPPKVRKGSGGVPLSESFGAAMHSLGANKLRALLTMLGVIIGVGAVVGLLAIGNGVTHYITGELEKNGTNLVLVRGQSATTNGVRNGQLIPSLTLEDAQTLTDPSLAPDATAVSPEVSQGATITAGSANEFATVNGVWPEYVTVHNVDTGAADFLTASDVSTNARVVVLGTKVAQTLFDTEEPVGRTVTIAGQGLRVIGVLPPGGGINSPDEQVYVPITTYLNSLFGDTAKNTVANHGRIVNIIWAKATSEKTADALAEEITDTLNARHRTAPGKDADFRVDTEADLLNQVRTILFFLQVFLALIASISLLVGGIGIMNIMLVSVTERTREIGIRKAVGAREKDILVQFIVEAMLIGFLGALLGVGLGFLIALLVTIAWQPSGVSLGSIIVAVTVAVATAMIFGVFPARRAARLNPIDALRYE